MACHTVALPWPPEVVLVSSRDRSVYGARLAHARVRGFLAKGELSGPANPLLHLGEAGEPFGIHDE